MMLYFLSGSGVIGVLLSERFRLDAVQELDEAGRRRYFYRVPWPVWRDMAEIYGRKYMTHAELSRYEVPATAGFIKFLHGIESEVLGKEATT